MSDYVIKLLTDVSDSTKSISKFADDAGKAADKLSSKFTAAFNTLGALAGVSLAAFSLKNAIDQAAEFQKDINQLRIALDATGQSSERAVQGFVDFAAALQKTTTFSDNAVLQTSALIQNLAQLSGSALKTATKAALDLSQALGIDLNSAASLVAKAANGNVSAFKRYGIEIRAGKTDAETFSNTLAVLQQRFGGASEKAVGTFSGAVAQLKNNFDDAIKTFGTAIITNEDFVRSINLASAGFVYLAEQIQANSGNISSFVSGFIKFADVLKNVFLPAVTGAGAALGFYFGATALAGTIQAIGLLTPSIGALVTGFVALTRATLASNAAALANPYVLAAVAVGGLVAWIVKLRQETASFADAFRVAGLQVLNIFAKLNPTVGNFDKQIEDIKNKKLTVDAKPALDTFDELNKVAKDYRAKIEETREAERVAAVKRRDEAIESFTKLQEAQKNAGKTELQILRAKLDEELKIINAAAKAGPQYEREAARLRLAVQADFALKSSELAKRDADRAIKDAERQRKLIQESSTDLLNFFINIGRLTKEFGAQGTIITGIGALASSIKQGAEGARKLIVDGLTFAATAILGPVGEALGPVFDLLSQGPDKVKQMVTEFTNAIPEVIRSINTAIPVLIQTLVQQLPAIVDGLIANIPFIINAFIDAIPGIMEAAVTLMPQVIQSLVAHAPEIITALVAATPRLIGALIKSIPQIVKGFIDAFITGIPEMLKSLGQGIVDAIKGAVSSATGGVTGLLGKVTGGVGGVVGGIGKKLGFADGGVVPPGYPNDSALAFVNSGEGIISNNTMDRLERFLASNQGGGPQMVTVNVQLGEKQLASVILDLNRRGFRLS